jgi:curved DNA-binding protein CbpA
MLPQRATTKTLYDCLGLSMTAPTEDIRSAYRRLARQWHPDRHKGDDFAKRRFQQIQEAYEVLIDSRSRQTYDLRLVHLLNVEDYLERFKELILTASGLDMQPARSAQPLPLGPDRRQLLLTAA